jgi:hypothetical protein
MRKQTPLVDQLGTNLPIGTISKTQDSLLWAWDPCVNCGKPRWVRVIGGKPLSCQCKQCANIKTGGVRSKNQHPYWKGGRGIYRGYAYVFVTTDSPYFAMATRTNKGKKGNVTSAYVFEHRYVMARHLGRLLNDDEIVHHINGIKTDNRLANLHLMKKEKHRTNYGTAFTEGYNLGYKTGFADAVKNRMELV